MCVQRSHVDRGFDHQDGTSLLCGLARNCGRTSAFTTVAVRSVWEALQHAMRSRCVSFDADLSE